MLEDAGPQTVLGWATNLSAGPSDEASQTLSFLVSNDNDSLFAVQPAIDATGKLTYKPAANANGSATVTVQIQDTGGTANGGADTSPPQTFTITVTPVNDAPSFVKGFDPTAFEDAGAQTVVNWANFLSRRAERGQSNAELLITNDNTGLFAVQPAIDAAGKLTYTPAANAQRLRPNQCAGAGQRRHGQRRRRYQRLSVLPFHGLRGQRRPSFTKGPDQTLFEDAGSQSVAGWATNLSSGPNEAGQLLNFVVSNNNASLSAHRPSTAAG